VLHLGKSYFKILPPQSTTKTSGSHLLSEDKDIFQFNGEIMYKKTLSNVQIRASHLKEFWNIFMFLCTMNFKENLKSYS
jgi:hypothetical protein